ncbi:MAG: hypothetical protein R2729_25665 [Bryobacteraceae bacterium]
MRYLILAAMTAAALGVEPAAEVTLTSVRRVHVDRLGGGETASHLRDMLIAALHRTGLFVVTENPETADAYLRGSAEDLIFTEVTQTSDGISGRDQIGVGSTSSRSTSGRFTGSVSVSDREATRSQHRKHEAAAAVRLVAKNGDVLWSTTQESLGAKFRGASADVADKITRQLTRDVERLRNGRAALK